MLNSVTLQLKNVSLDRRAFREIRCFCTDWYSHSPLHGCLSGLWCSWHLIAQTCPSCDSSHPQSAFLLNLPCRYGEIVDVNLVRDKATGKSRGFSFVAYEDQRSTTLAVGTSSLAGLRSKGPAFVQEVARSDFHF